MPLEACIWLLGSVTNVPKLMRCSTQKQIPHCYLAIYSVESLNMIVDQKTISLINNLNFIFADWSLNLVQLCDRQVSSIDDSAVAATNNLTSI